jgi:hypothetical protein
MSRDAVGAFAPLLVFIAFLLVLFVWDRRSRNRRQTSVLVAVGRRRAFSTRPPLLKEQDFAVIEQVRSVIDTIGLGPPKVLMFQGEPTLDMIIETDEPHGVIRQLKLMLANVPVQIANVGRPGDLTWFMKLWRHI